MKGPWQVTSNFINNKKMYAVYRQLDVAKIDCSDNRELASGYVDVLADASALADKLNTERKSRTDSFVR